MRRSSLVASITCCILAALVATAAAGPPGSTPPTKKSSAPAGATIISSLVVLFGTLVVYDGAFPSCLDDCADDEEQMAIGGAILLVAPTLVRLPAREIGGIHLGLRFAGGALIAGAAMARSDDTTPYLIGAGLIIAGAISDVVTVHGAYRRWNERHAITVAPVTLSPGGLAPGVSLGGRF